MIILKILRWLRGYVFFKASGKFPERFINMTIRQRIALWDIVGGKCEMTSYCYAKDYRYLLPVARKTGVRIRTVKKRGLPFIINKHRNRGGLIVGIIIFAIIIKLLSMRIWAIEIKGIEKLNETNVRVTLSSLGLSEGIASASLNLGKIERDATLKLGGISWMSINISGPTATVELKESDSKTKNELEKLPSNIKATNEGVITRMEIADGKAEVKIGGAVAKGELLVSGVIEDGTGNAIITHANAKVYAKTLYSKTIEIPLKNVKAMPTGNIIERLQGSVLLFKFPLSFAYVPDGDYRVQRFTECIEIKENRLPVLMLTESLYEYKSIKINYSSAEAISAAKEMLALHEAFFLKDKILLNRSVKSEVKNGVLVFKVNYTCEENIAADAPFTSEELRE